jgi:Helix-turn-helix domain
MAGTSLQRPIGLGPALEKARRIRGLSLEEASRDTRLRTDHLAALEAERFEALPNDAFVRGALRTYAQYLGVSSEKVLGVYALHADDPVAPPPPAGLGRIERAIAATRIRDNQRFLLTGAAVIVALLLLFGLLARDRGAPPPAAIGTTSAPTGPAVTRVDAVLVADRPVEVTVTEDGARETLSMEEGETRSFAAEEELVLSVADGGSVHVIVGERDLGMPGEPGSPWTQTFAAVPVSETEPSTGNVTP